MMLAYQNSQSVKDLYVGRFDTYSTEVRNGTRKKYHLEADPGRLALCLLGSHDCALAPAELGWPEWLMLLASNIYDTCSKTDALRFGAELLEAIQPGANLEPVRWQLAIARHQRQLIALEKDKAPYTGQVRTALLLAIDYAEDMLGNAFENDDAKRIAACLSVQSAAASAIDASARFRGPTPQATRLTRASWSSANAAGCTVAEDPAAVERAGLWRDKWTWERDTLLAVILGLR